MDRGRDRNTSLFCFQQQCTLLSYVPTKNKVILLLFSMHNDDKIDEYTGDAQKPKIITSYNKSKGGVDVVDKLCASYTSAQNTRRLPIQFQTEEAKENERSPSVALLYASLLRRGMVYELERVSDGFLFSMSATYDGAVLLW